MTVSFLPVAEPFQMQKEGIRGVEVQVLWMAIQVPVNLSAKKSTFRPPPTRQITYVLGVAWPCSLPQLVALWESVENVFSA